VLGDRHPYRDSQSTTALSQPKIRKQTRLLKFDPG
jgi:hypothetical protein